MVAQQEIGAEGIRIGYSFLSKALDGLGLFLSATTSCALGMSAFLQVSGSRSNTNQSVTRAGHASVSHVTTTARL